MATIQSKITNGKKYWYIVESRRVNGKPRPVVLEYLGKADDLLARLSGLKTAHKLKSYSHGHVAALVDTCVKFNICSTLNQFTQSDKDYISDKPVRHNLTVGATLMLVAICRACVTVSKNGFLEWVKTTSLGYLLRASFDKIDSQHFWNMMDCFPANSIAAAETMILKDVFKSVDLENDTLLYDTTNFYTYINTQNTDCSISKRGKNKQKRCDLRQVGLALVVTKQDMIPVFHHTYEGNMNDSKVFINVINSITERITALGMKTPDHTIVFDRGNNSKKNLEFIQSLSLNFVGALTPYHHKELITEASPKLLSTCIGDDVVGFYRTRKAIWGLDLTVVVVISDKLKTGLINGLYTSIEKCDEGIAKTNESLKRKTTRKRSKQQLEKSVRSLLTKHKSSDFISFAVVGDEHDGFFIGHQINYDALAKAEEKLGFRIIMTNRHNWTSEEIIKAYHGQSFIESTFKNMKDQTHLSFKPQFHWTDQKIRVHYFCCVIGYLLNALLYKRAKEEAGFAGSMSSFLNKLDNMRLGSIISDTGKKGAPRVEYQLEVLDSDDQVLLDCLDLQNIHITRPKVSGLGVYN